MDQLTPTLLLAGLGIPEAPRWHQGKLWFSDIMTRKVFTVDTRGRAQLVVDVPEHPSGLGFLPDGRLLVVSMEDRRLLRLDPNGLVVHADLKGLTTGLLNDMVVDSQGRAYAGATLGNLVLVNPDGKARVAADNLDLPNGVAVTSDGRILIVAETRGKALTAFSVQADGSLTHRRTFAKLDGMPNGICLDADDGVWVASLSGEFLRVKDGGAIADRIPMPGRPGMACALGGDDRRTLFLLTLGQDPSQEVFSKGGVFTGRIETVRVEVPGVGWP